MGYNATTMANVPGVHNSQCYTEENCKDLLQPFLLKFVDIDTYKYDGQKNLRIQGYLQMRITDFAEYSVDQIDLVLKIATGKDSHCTWAMDETGLPRLEVWRYKLTMKLPF